ncbi:dephospho-CoA kinase [Luteitalea sp. TBR-22]|uniref:dephospho-CoA kinase n=1 Tax=Luteitalea sp. TBR-22 TaxID=2802971 RepID=UPI001AF73238|nr:dephospho-CoA kinase [Luteitalea sp. TBR-22]BCS33846.1 dephospho-CoA kinase [Luteitalea sp. TBR-22]
MPDGVLRVGLTGGIATGKSYVTRRLAEAGLPTIDADRLAREAVAPGTDGLRAVVARFGREVLTDGGALDRARLGAIVFADAAARADLEGIIHPEVRRRIDAWQRQLARQGYRGPAIADIPLLFETGRTADFDVVVVVACDPARQRERLMARDGLSAEAADVRLAAQWPIAEKVKAADEVVITDGTFDDTDAQVDALVARLHARASGESRAST